MKNRIKAIIFDFDGPVVDSVANSFLAYREICRRLGVSIPFADLKEFQNWHDPYWPNNLKRLGIKDKKTLAEQEKVYQEVTQSRTVAVVPGMKMVLQQLSRKYMLALVSSNYKRDVEQKIEDHDLKKYFKVIVPHHQEFMKPDPGQFYMAMKKLKVTPDETATVGDSANDILTGKNAKLRETIAVSWGWYNVERLTRDFQQLRIQPSAIVHTPKELLHYFTS